MGGEYAGAMGWARVDCVDAHRRRDDGRHPHGAVTRGWRGGIEAVQVPAGGGEPCL